MKAQELRIGNYVNISKEVCKMQLVNFVEIHYTEYFFENYEPIPLTEEWLMNFGFELINNDYWQSRSLELKLHWTVNKNKMIPEFNDKRLIVGYDFKHVHQLQNLYFALTNEELKIK